MFEKLRIILQKDCALLPGQPIIVGVSGGPDSLCLFDLLHKIGYSLVAACLIHGIRPEAAEEAEMVRALADQIGVPYVSKSVDTPTYAADHRMSIESAARKLRYDFLFEQAVEYHAQAIAIGHTADDQAETVLMHLLRGAGLSGLKGMEYRSWLPVWSQQIPLVRPLLSIWRTEVMDYCQENGLKPIHDPTNLSIDFFRNRLRLEILPYLEQFQPRIRQNLVRTALTLAGDLELVKPQIQAAWHICLVQQGDGYVAFNRNEFLRQPVAIQRYLLRKALSLHRLGLQDIDLAAIERARACLGAQARYKSCDLIAGLRLVVEQDLVWVTSWEADLPPGNWPAVSKDRSADLAIPGTLVLENDWVVIAEVCRDYKSVRETATENTNPYQVWLDKDKLSQPLSVRARLPGDRIQPLGMNGSSMKVSDLMINLKLPPRSRATWPLVCAANEVLWVAGCRSSHIARLRVDTSQVIHLTLMRVIDMENIG
jgi:tRNA(Ile)-lysidine synthase